MAAQAGTSTGPADAVGVADGLALGIGEGLSGELGVMAELVDGDGLLCVAALELPHAATASKVAKTASRTPTGI